MSDFCAKCGKTRHPLPFGEWMEAVKKEDVLECGRVVDRAPRQWRQLWESYERHWGKPNELDQLRHQLQQAEARVAELEATLYHGNLEREKCQKVMILRKQAEAVEGFLSEIHKSQRQQEEDFEVSISHSLISQHRLEDYAQRLRQQADELQAGDVGRE